MCYNDGNQMGMNPKASSLWTLLKQQAAGNYPAIGRYNLSTIAFAKVDDSSSIALAKED